MISSYNLHFKKSPVSTRVISIYYNSHRAENKKVAELNQLAEMSQFVGWTQPIFLINILIETDIINCYYSSYNGWHIICN